MINAEEESTAGVPEWFVTFADMMSLLLAFFIMLVSMGSFEAPAQFQSLVTMLHKQFGSSPSRVNTGPGHVAAADDVPDAHELTGTRTGGVIFFDGLATRLTDENKRAIAQIARQLTLSDATIEIRGHAGEVPLDPLSGLRDHWDVADRRCHSTMAFLIEQGVDPSRIRLANAGTSEPLYRGADAQRLGQNSRVEIRLMTPPPDGF